MKPCIGLVDVSQRLYLDNQAVEVADDDGLAFFDGFGTVCGPGFALQPDLTVARECVHRATDAADDRISAGNGAAPSHPHDERHQPDDEGSRDNGDTDDKCQRDTETRNAAVEHHDGAENKRDNAAEPQRPETWRESFCGH